MVLVQQREQRPEHGTVPRFLDGLAPRLVVSLCITVLAVEGVSWLGVAVPRYVKVALGFVLVVSATWGRWRLRLKRGD